MKRQAGTLARQKTSSDFLAASGILQRKCGCGRHTHGAGTCPACCKKQAAALQPAVARAAPVHGVPPVVSEVLAAPGRALDRATRACMEARFGHDFSQVRLHTDTKAADSARAVNALAYTAGRHIVFAADGYKPETAEGKKVLAHELTHVLQQERGQGARPSVISSPGDRHEQEAEEVARVVSAGGSAQRLRGQPSLRGPQVPVCLQRLIRTSLVTGCGAHNPWAADRRAVHLLETAIAKIDSAVAQRPLNPAHADVVLVGTALHTAFRLPAADANTWTQHAPHVKVPVIRRRLEIAKNYINSVVFTVNCPGAAGNYTFAAAGCGTITCTPGVEAWSCHLSRTELALCPPFWALSANQRGRTFAHEIFHVNFGFIDDWGQADVHNAHCYAQFIALLNGFNSPAGFTCH